MISIIIPLYNRQELIKETVESILSQTSSEWECIIVDDGSRDNSFNIANEYTKKDNRIKVYIRPDNILSGGNGARNYGVTKASGSHICWFDSDDLMHRDFIMEFKKKLSLNNGANLHICNISRFCDDSLKELDQIWYNENNNFIKDQITEKNKIFFQNSVFKKDFVLENKLDERLSNSQDYEYFSRIILYCNPILIHKPLTKIRVHSKNISSNPNSPQFISSEFLATESILSYIKNNSPNLGTLIPWLIIRNISAMIRSMTNDSLLHYKTIRAALIAKYIPHINRHNIFSIIFMLEDFLIICQLKLRIKISKKYYYIFSKKILKTKLKNQ